MNVLSLFDGMSCGQIALNRLNIPITNYFASEVDKHAMKVTMANFPNTIQLGDVRNIDTSTLPKIDLLIGGSPCQSFSFAGKRKGMSTKCEVQITTLNQYLKLKEEKYEFEGQSYLFWEYMRIKSEVNPTHFLLENVIMEERWARILSKAIGVNPIEINSSLVSAQNRRRLYWTNIGMEPRGLFGDMESVIGLPKDKGIFLRDILEPDVDEKYYLSDNMINWLATRNGKYSDYKIDPDKTGALNTKNNSPQLSTDSGTTFITNPDGKSKCFTAGGNSGGLHSQMDVILVASRGRNPENPTSRESGLPTEQQLEPRLDGKTNCLTSVQKDNLIITHNTMSRSSKSGKGGTGPLSKTDGKSYCLDTGNTNAIEIKQNYIQWPGDGFDQDRLAYPEDGKSGSLDCKPERQKVVVQINPSKESGGKQPFQQNRVYDPEGISLALQAQLSTGSNNILQGSRIRRLTPIECERLQTVPDNYTNHVSDTQRYKMLGNGWTIDVIAFIFSHLFKSANS